MSAPFLDRAATILICARRIFLPICMQYGHEGRAVRHMLMVINCRELGSTTPQVGTTQFVGCAIGGISVGQVMRPILPFYGALISRPSRLVTYVPVSPRPAALVTGKLSICAGHARNHPTRHRGRRERSSARDQLSVKGGTSCATATAASRTTW